MRPPDRTIPTAPASARALSVAASLVWIPQAFVLAGAVAGVVEGRLAGMADVASAAGLFLLLAVLRAGLDAWSARIAAGFATREKRRLRRMIAETAAAWSPVDATRPAPGEIALLASDQVESLDPYLTRYGPARTRLMVVPLAIALVVAAVSWASALILLLAFPFIPLFTSLIGAEARDRSRAQLAEVGTFTGVLLDRLSGLTTIRLFGAVDRTAEAIADAGDRIRRRTMSVLALAFLSSAVIELFSSIAVALVAVWVGFTLLGWIGFGATLAPVDLATGLFVLFLAPDFFQPLRDFSAAYHDKAAADALDDRLEALVRPARAGIVGTGGRAPTGDAGPPPAVTVEGLTVAAPDGAVLVEGVSLDVAAGERVALFGPSGSGKSTVLAAIAGLVAPSAGTVRLGGAAVDAATADAARGRIAWVGQAPLALAGSLERNLTLIAPGDRAAMDRALAAARLDGLVARLPRGLRTPLGETGAGLSGGELRRLAVARALLADRPLILADEPTADLDAETAEAVRGALAAAAEGRTLIVATHDPALARRMDRVIRLEPRAAGNGIAPAGEDHRTAEKAGADGAAEVMRAADAGAPSRSGDAAVVAGSVAAGEGRA
ncbi:thiol reductant ABC exporter subunit CydD [Chthonobacter rhizosphaerae]|uniref:thiol reductant ABC exporter subunit CydD n=1 Tax=Chthonobacter rhizosphaerae TaxID=2735553 RepID=UPI0015EEE325|nr:thiol reductant ABC exporter subunit CydD [Chthonobacter rhizosphaerae]